MRAKLKELREARGFSQITFSKAVGISRSHYNQIEAGGKDPSLKVSLRIKRKLGYEGDDIFFNSKCP